MKRKIGVIFLICSILLCVMSGCGESYRRWFVNNQANDLKVMIPDVRMIFEEHYRLIRDAQKIMKKEAHLGTHVAINDGQIEVDYIPGNAPYPPELTTFFTREESIIIEEFFALESDGVQFQYLDYNKITVAYIDSMRLEIYDVGYNEEDIARWKSMDPDHYVCFEEVYDGWYAVIII